MADQGWPEKIMQYHRLGKLIGYSEIPTWVNIWQDDWLLICHCCGSQCVSVCMCMCVCVCARVRILMHVCVHATYSVM